MATVWQSFNLFPWRTILDNVAFGLEMIGVSRAEREARAREALVRVDLAGFEDKVPRQLSGGMRQRVGLARALVDLFRNGGLGYDLVITLWRIFAGFAIAVVLGVAIGIWMATSERMRAVADLYIAALYPLPKITLIPLLIIWLGTGGPFMLTISALGAIFPIIINTVLGIRQCDAGLVLAARDLRANQSQIILKVLLPSAIPSIFAGIRLGLGVSIILVVAAEMVVGKVGLGGRLFLAGQVLETEQVFAVLIVLAILGIVVTKIQDAIDVWLGHWRID
jgi:NitT/TauT family transport system permease protein